MKVHLPKIPKPILLAGVLSMSFFSPSAQTFVASNAVVHSESTESKVSSVKLRDAILTLRNSYHVDILFEENILEGHFVDGNSLKSDSGVESELKALLSPNGLEFFKTKKSSYIIIKSQSTKAAEVSTAPLTMTTEVTPVIDASSLSLTVANASVAISGTVKDESGNGMPGVNILEKGTSNGTSTDAQGNFNLSVQGESSILVLSFIGYLTEEVTVGVNTKIDVNMSPDIKSLSEVVVIGYGSKEKRDITGSVADIKASEIKQTVAMSPQMAMQGRMTGVYVSGGGGDPNARPTINIRGISTFGNNSQPLYIVDGIPIAEFGEGSTVAVNGARAADLRGNQNILNLINPSDIESISVLKDASAAAVYGVRAANGVVLITTKRGKEGKPKLDVSISRGVMNIRKKLDLLNTQEYASIYQEIVNNDKYFDRSSNDNQWYRLSVPTDTKYRGNDNTTNWQDAIINKNAVVENYNANLSGGTEFAKYSVGGGYSKQEGALKYVNQSRYSFTVNTDFKVKPWLEVGETGRVAYTDVTDNRDPIGVPLTLKAALTAPPWQPIYDPTNKDDGFAKIDKDKYGSASVNNFVARTRYSNLKYGVLRLMGSGYVTLIPVKGLRIKGTVSIDNTQNNRTNWAQNAILNNYMANGVTASDGNMYMLQNTTNYGLTKELSASYAKDFGDHHFDVLLNASQQTVTFNSLVTSVLRIPMTDPATYSISNGDPMSTQSSNWREGFAIQGYLSRLSYKFRDKYYLDATLMRNGSSRFAPGYRWGNFPAFAAAWRISSENFMQGVTVISDLKLRGSWGKLGNQDTRAYAFLNLVNRNSEYSVGSATGGDGAGKPQTGAFIGDYPTTNLTWEKVRTSSIATDFALLNNALSMTIEYYDRSTNGILQGVAFPGTAGLNNNPTKNVADVSNRGVEISANYRKKIGQFDLTLGGNLTTVKNTVKTLYNGVTIYDDAHHTRIKQGTPINSIYGYKTDGIFRSQSEIDAWKATNMEDVGHMNQLAPGDYHFKDLYSDVDQKGAPDGKITGVDQAYLGKTIPGYYYGFTLGATYKNFDFTALFQGVGDVKRINQVKMDGEYMGGNGSNWLTTTRNRWTAENPNAALPRAIYSDPSGNNRFSNRFVENGAFLRLNNVQLGYTIPKGVLGKIGASNLRLYVQSTNTFVVTKYTGLDPEGNDYNPTPRTVLFGLNASF